MGKAGLWVRSDIGVGPAVEGAFLDTREEIVRKIVAESVALLKEGRTRS